MAPNTYARLYGKKQIDDIGIFINPQADSIRLSPIIDPRLASLLNDLKEIEIGQDTIFRIQNDYTFMYSKGHEKEIREFYSDIKNNKVILPSGNAPINYASIRVYKTEVIINNIVQAGGRTKGDNECELHALNDEWRVWGRVYTHWSFVYTSAGMESRSQGKRRKCPKLFGSCWYSWDVDKPADYFAMKYDMCVFYGDAPQQQYTAEETYSNIVMTRFMGETTGYNLQKYLLNGWLCTKGTLQGTSINCPVTRTDNSYWPPWVAFNPAPLNCP